MLVEITETCRQTENLNYPCEHLTVGFISEEQLQALARQAGLHLPIPTERESLMRNAVSVSENAFWCVLHLINPGQILGQRDKIGLLIVKNCFLVVDLFDEDDSTGEAVNRMLQSLQPKKATLPRLVTGFFREILIQDPDIHEDLETRIDTLEKEVFDARAPHFRQQTLQLGKELLTLNRYYDQLININDHLEENSNDLFAEDELRSFTQVLILSDTFEEFAQPLMKKLGWPTIFCNSLEVAPDGEITGFKMRCEQSKLTTVKALQSMGYETIAAGDSYNDLGMIQASKAGFLFKSTDKIKADHPELPAFEEFGELLEGIRKAL